MGWSVRLENEHGKPVVDNDVGIEFDTLEGVSPTGLLRYIDPCGNTVFNRMQMPDFISEWSRIQPDDPAQKLRCAEVLGMAKRCAAEPHFYLRFIGN